MSYHRLPVSGALALTFRRQQQQARQARDDSYHRLGGVLQEYGQLERAVVAYQTALKLRPDNPVLHYKLGVAQQQRGQLPEALAAYRAALRLQPDFAEAHNNLGVVLQVQGDLTGAVRSYRTAIYVQSDYHEAYNNLGTALHMQGEYFAATAAFEVALRLCGDDAEIHNNLGVVRRAQGNLGGALGAFQTALHLKPDYPEAYNNLGTVLQAQGNFAAARVMFQVALSLRPHYPEAHNNLGTVWQGQGDLGAAAAAFEAALALQSDYTEAQWNRALLWLTQGQLARGWPAYEWRWRAQNWPTWSVPIPQWAGDNLAGRQLLIRAEQGVGDELLFASCLPDVIALAGHVVLECDARLAALFGRSFPTATVRGCRHESTHDWLAEVPPIDVHLLIGSLPQYLRGTLGSFPPQIGYLQADSARRGWWQQRLAALGPGLKVGLAWRSLRARHGQPTYTRLEQWAPILTLPGIHWVNLQYDDGADDLRMVRNRWGVQIQTWEDLNLFQDIDAVAALITVLDLVIAPETMVAALAGGLGQHVWRLSRYTPAWDTLGTEVSPWFPSMRLYRQPRPGDWSSVFERMAADLQRLLRGASRP